MKKKEPDSSNQMQTAIMMAVPVADGKLCNHFGHCEEFALVSADPDTRQILFFRTLKAPPHQPGLLPRWLHEQGVTVVIAGGMGRRAQDLFAQNGIQVVVGAPADAPETLVRQFLAGDLRCGDNLCDH